MSLGTLSKGKFFSLLSPCIVSAQCLTILLCVKFFLWASPGQYEEWSLNLKSEPLGGQDSPSLPAAPFLQTPAAASTLRLPVAYSLTGWLCRSGSE